MGRTVAELMSGNISNAITNVKTWGGIIYNVKEYGAKGDGVTDDTTAIQKAIDEAKATGGKVAFPPGIYLVSRLTIDLNVRLFSFGGALIKQIPQTSGSMIFISGTGLKVDFENLIFDGNNKNQAAKSRNNIVEVRSIGTIDNPFVVYFENCEFKNQAFCSLNFYSDLGVGTGNEYLFVQDCQFYGGNEGDESTYDTRYISANDGAIANIDNCLFDLLAEPSGYGIAGIVMASTSSSTPAFGSLTVTDCEFRHIGRNAPNSLGCIDFYIYSEQVFIAGNKFYDCHSSPIKGKTNSKSVRISGNFIKNVAGNDHGIAVQASTTADAFEQFMISQNTIKDVGGSGISVDSLTNDYVTDVIVSENMMRNIGGRGIEIIRTERSKVSGNNLNGIGSVGIWLNNCRGQHVFTENTIKTAGSFGIYGDNGISDVRLVCNNNSISASTKYGIYFAGLLNITLTGNQVMDIVDNNGRVGYFLGGTISKAIVQGNIAENVATPFQNLATITTLKESGNSWNP